MNKRVMQEGSLPGARSVVLDDDGLTPEQQEIKKLWEAIERIDHHLAAVSQDIMRRTKPSKERGKEDG